MSYLPFYLAFAIVLSWSSHSVAELYRWTDAQGVVHFTDQKPDATDTTRWSSSPLPEATTVQSEPVGALVYTARPAAKQSPAVSGNQTAHLKSVQACAKAEADLERVQSQLRAGYREPRGNRLRAKKRHIRMRLARQCR